MKRSHSTASGVIHIHTGSEGSPNDPYGYVEYECIRNNKSMKLHSGLAFWLEDTNGVKHDGYTNELEKAHVSNFETFMGCSLRTLEKSFDILESRCKTCHSRNIRQEMGYPGETLLVCENGHITGAWFCESEVI